jgi:hypothetical protein
MLGGLPGGDGISRRPGPSAKERRRMSLKTVVAAVVAVAWWRHAQRKRTLESVRREQEDRLDEALDESFPASDPPSITPVPIARLPVR